MKSVEIEKYEDWTKYSDAMNSCGHGELTVHLAQNMQQYENDNSKRGN